MASHERIPKWKALAVLSSDALSSVAYATEEILIPLAALTAAAVTWSIPIALAIAALLVIITVSYRQTIDSYPGGGGAYIVARENLGTTAGLVAGASLLIDYVLTVSVSVASGVENVAAALPALTPHKVALDLAIILVVMLLNLRGIRESASIFAFPTYLFIGSFCLMLGVGAWNLMTGHIAAVAPVVHATYPAVPVMLILRAFASGCSALTGVEAISNGIPVFQEPAQKNAKTTLVWMSVILGVMFLGNTFLAYVFGLVPKDDETVISLLSHSVFGNSFMYYLVQASTGLILVLAANTSYADFPRLASLLAKDRFLPRQLASLGDRLVFSNGILGLSIAAAVLVILFNGETHHLIPLYAVGVFLSFTLSQAGMVKHHLKEREKNWKKSLFFNALGSFTTAIVLVVIATTKFMHGAWMVVLLIPLIVLFFNRIHHHYTIVGKELTLGPKDRDFQLAAVKHTVVVPISGIHRGVIDALRYAITISDDVRACYVELDAEATARVQAEWQRWATGVPLVILKSPYRSVIRPLMSYVDDISSVTNRELVTIVIPEFVTAKWRHSYLHNQTAFFFRTALMFKRGLVVTSVRYHLKSS